MIVCVDVQHIGKKSSPHDTGAYAFGKTEIWFTLRYGKLIAEELKALGHTVYFSAESLTDGILDGDYSTRHEFANKIEADLYIACHVNAGGADYALVEIQRGAYQKTIDLANSVAQAMKDAVPCSRAVVNKIGDGERGWNCISGIKKPCAILLEPFFIDNAEDARFMSTDEGTKRLAHAVVSAISLWAKKYQVGE